MTRCKYMYHKYQVSVSDAITTIGLSSKVQRYECPLLHDYTVINSGLQLTISPTLLSPMLSSVGNPSGGVVPLVALIP